MTVLSHNMKRIIITLFLTIGIIYIAYSYLNKKKEYTPFRYTNNDETKESPILNEQASKNSNKVSVEQGRTKVFHDDTGRLVDLIDNWKMNKSKSIIYLLTRPARLLRLRMVLSDLDMCFLDRFNYPVVIFYSDYKFTYLIPSLRSLFKADLFFIPTEFRLPKFLLPSEEWPEPLCQTRVGYNHMCRFHAKTLFEFPWIEQLDYYWRLDDDSRILAPINYDVFTYMRNHGFLYGYHKITAEIPTCTFGLDETIEKHMQLRLSSDFYDKRHWLKMYYNNFEISKVSVWTSQQYKDYIEAIDKAGGIFYYRWGDAPMKTVAVRLFVPANKIHHFEDIAYEHLNWIQHKKKYGM